jgi:PAS domain-containing protein
MNSGTTAFLYVSLRVVVALALGATVGWLTGSIWAGISGVLGLYLAWNLWQLRELWFWLQHRSVADPPDAMGLWGDVVAQVVRLHRRKRFHKERLTRLFRELRRSTAAMPDGVVMLDPLGEIVWFNRKAGELLDLSRRADLGLRIDNLVRHPDFVDYLHGGQYSLPIVVRIDTHVEKYVAFQLISYGEGQRLLMLRDVTREVRLEQMRKDFVANASHELRSPLTVVAGYLETFGADPGLGELTAPIAEMRRQTDRMTRIIEDLLERPSMSPAWRRCCARTFWRGPLIRARSNSPSNRQPSCWVTKPWCSRRSRTWSTMPRSTRHPMAACRSAGGRMPKEAISRYATRGPVFPPSTFPGSRNVSTAWIRAARAKPAAPAWGWPS